ncbi:MAG: Na/Pi cotransporter family protein [Firmicutes bacterium]|nr:Na/Pi cotransporter family protein [Bacillota bacterium]
MTPIYEGVFILVGALGLFLYANSRFGDGIQKVLGEKIRTSLENQAREPLSSVFTGILMAALLQNNPMIFGMVSSLVNASLLGLFPALWIMLGASLGMTTTTQLMALNLAEVPYLLLFMGFLLYNFGKNRDWHHFGQVVFNLGLMYIGFHLFQEAFTVLINETESQRFLAALFRNHWLGFLLGLSLAALFRGSNTIVVLVQGIAAINLVAITMSPSAGMEVLTGMMAIIIGAQVGTSITNLAISFDRLPAVQKVSWLYFLFNVTTALGWLLFLPRMVIMVETISKGIHSGFVWFGMMVFKWDPAPFLLGNWFRIWELAMGYSVFCLTVILLWFPITVLSSKRGFGFSEKGKVNSNGVTYLDRRALQSPALALILAGHEINQMATIALEMLKSARLAFLKNQVHLISSINRDETIVDDLQEQITFYLSAILSQNSLTEAQSHRLAGLLHVVSDIERVGDHSHNIAHLAERKSQEQLPFSELALNEIELFFGKSIDLYQKSGQALRDNNLELAKQVLNREENIDKLEEELRQNHIYRLNQGKCWPGSGVIYVEILSNLQRVAAHAANIAAVVLEEGGE